MLCGDTGGVGAESLARTTGETEHRREVAELLREEGNRLYEKQKFEEAVGKYTQSLTMNPGSAVVISNRGEWMDFT